MESMAADGAWFGRTALLMGNDFMDRMAEVRVMVVGVGGVGSWCAECLARSGVGHLAIVDSDRVCASNVNRQLMATSRTLGALKVEALGNRLLEINPRLDLQMLPWLYSEENADRFRMEEYDYVVDAIDSLRDKAQLILQATALMRAHKHFTFFSSMGAALRTDPFAVSHTEFWKVEGDPLARMLRKRFKATGRFPQSKFQCVYSTQLPRENRGKELQAEADRAEGTERKPHVNGTLAQVTIVFGIALAGLVVCDVERRLGR